MKSYFIFKFLTGLLKEYLFIFLAATIIIFISSTKSFSGENVFTINNVKVKGAIDLNFSREKYFNKAFQDSFEILMNKILLTRDLKKIRDIKIKQIKNLISSFQIMDESYSKDEYRANIKIFYSESKIKIFLGNKNIPFSQPENITAVFFPILFIDNEIQSFRENFFYDNWNKIEIKNELINFILPLEDLEDISKIVEMKDQIENLNINNLVNKYDVKNYVFTLMSYQNKKLNIYLKTSFNSNLVSRNISYDLMNINDNSILNSILKDLKLKITDLWKEENLVNLLMPLSIQIKFQHTNIEDFDKFRNILRKISIIQNYTLEEFNTNNSFYKIYYYGNPKKLKSELLKFGYRLSNDQGYWQINLND